MVYDHPASCRYCLFVCVVAWLKEHQQPLIIVSPPPNLYQVDPLLSSTRNLGQTETENKTWHKFAIYLFCSVWFVSVLLHTPPGSVRFRDAQSEVLHYLNVNVKGLNPNHFDGVLKSITLGEGLVSPSKWLLTSRFNKHTAQDQRKSEKNKKMSAFSRTRCDGVHRWNYSIEIAGDWQEMDNLLGCQCRKLGRFKDCQWYQIIAFLWYITQF